MTDNEQRRYRQRRTGERRRISVAASVGETVEGGPQGRTRRPRPKTKKQLVIHAGLHRTGTTAIQEALSGSRDLLAAKGISYPFDFAPGDTGQQRRKNHLNLAFALLRGEISPDQVMEWLDKVASGSWKVILSAEDFCRLEQLQFLEPLFEAYDTKVVFYLRRQDEWLNSWYNQHLRWPFDDTLARTTPTQFLEYIDRFKWLRYFDLLERWERVLGRDKLHVRVFEKGQVTDAVADLFEISRAFRPRPRRIRTNESVPASQLELLRRLELIKHPNNARVVVLDACVARLAIPSAPAPTSIPRRCAGVILPTLRNTEREGRAGLPRPARRRAVPRRPFPRRRPQHRRQRAAGRGHAARADRQAPIDFAVAK